ncbi:MAG TPA: histidine kinase [Actinoplanes sp.]|nr:histidine kinase [Actinoplanes sp.]
MTARRAGPWAAVALGVAALTEVAVTAGPSAALPLRMMLALAVTAPVAVAPAQPVLAAVAILTAGVIAVLSDVRPPAAGALALCAAATVAAVRIRNRQRADAAAREASRRMLSDSLLENQVRGERARIARELHDVVAHHVSLIAVQADTVRLATPGLSAGGVAGLTTIGDTARTALSEMRRLLGVLREDEPQRAPQPGLDQLNELVDAARAAGRGTARLIVQGPVRPLSPGLELTAYRIVQEALSNARRHAPGAGIDVDLRYAPDRVLLRIRDNGPAVAVNGAGLGLTGMRERAAMIGGTVTAGPAYPAGFLVEAVLPIGEEPS